MLPRLKTAEQFAAALDASKHKSVPGTSGIWRSAHFVLHMAPLAALTTLPALKVSSDTNPEAKATIGVICPKRWAKRAVTRNTIKRQIYAVSSELAFQLPPSCLVVRLASGFAREQFKSATSPALKAVVRHELMGLFGKVARPPAPLVSPAATV